MSRFSKKIKKTDMHTWTWLFLSLPQSPDFFFFFFFLGGGGGGVGIFKRFHNHDFVTKSHDFGENVTVDIVRIS